MEVENAGNSDAGEGHKGSFRAEIDTSAPFQSVKEAVTRFGGVGYWKPTLNTFALPQHVSEEVVDAGRLEEQKDVLQKELIFKERETLEVLKELERTKRLVEDLRSKVQKEESEVNNVSLQMKNVCDNNKTEIIKEKEDKENQMSPFPGLILMELKQAKLNLTRTTTDLTDVRASVESLNKKLDKERISLEKTRERLTQNSSKIASLEEELNQTKLKLEVTKDADEKKDPSDLVTKELHRLSSEAENLKRIGEAAKSQVLRTMSEIEETKTMITTAEIRLVAARKMKEAAKAAEAMAIAEINALWKYNKQDDKDHEVTLSFAEYSALTQKAREAEEHSNKKVVEAMVQVDGANASKMDILKRVEEAKEEVKSSKKALEEALERVEAANRGKLGVEEALRKWRSEGNKRRSSTVQNSTKFKNPYPSSHSHSRLLDVNGLNLVNDDDEVKPVLKPTLSIGQILSRKLLLPEDYEAGPPVGGGGGGRNSVKRKVSLGQMLGKQNDDGDGKFSTNSGKAEKQFSSAKRKKFGFGRFSLLLAKQQKKKKKPTSRFR